MPYKDKQKNREYQKEWAKRKRGGIPTKIINRLSLTIEERKDRRKKQLIESSKRRRAKINRLIMESIGNKCFICGSTLNLASHKKDGSKHHELNTIEVIKQLMTDSNKWVRLCYPCHKSIHWIMKYFRWDWKKIITFIGLQNKK